MKARGPRGVGWRHTGSLGCKRSQGGTPCKFRVRKENVACGWLCVKPYSVDTWEEEEESRRYSACYSLLEALSSVDKGGVLYVTVLADGVGCWLVFTGGQSFPLSHASLLSSLSHLSSRLIDKQCTSQMEKS